MVPGGREGGVLDDVPSPAAQRGEGRFVVGGIEGEMPGEFEREGKITPRPGPEPVPGSPDVPGAPIEEPLREPPVRDPAIRKAPLEDPPPAEPPRRDPPADPREPGDPPKKIEV